MAMLSYVLAVFCFSCIFSYPCFLKSVLSMLVLSHLLQDLIESVPFACLVAPAIAWEKSTQYRLHLNVQLLPFLVQAVSWYIPIEDLLRFPFFRLVLLCSLGLVLLCKMGDECCFCSSVIACASASLARLRPDCGSRFQRNISCRAYRMVGVWDETSLRTT